MKVKSRSHFILISHREGVILHLAIETEHAKLDLDQRKQEPQIFRIFHYVRAFQKRHQNTSLIHSNQQSYLILWASLVAQLVKNLPVKPGDLGLIPGLGRSPREGKGYPLQYSGLENSMDCIVHGVEKSWT